MEDKKYPCWLGQTLANLISLETVIRVYLSKKEGKDSFDLSSIKIGDVVSVNSFTDYSQLSRLIFNYNNYQISEDDKIDLEKIIKIRDLIAHARGIQISESGPLIYIKFSEPRKNETTVEVTDKEIINEKWFESSTNYIRQVVEKVAGALPKIN